MQKINRKTRIITAATTTTGVPTTSSTFYDFNIKGGVNTNKEGCFSINYNGDASAITLIPWVKETDCKDTSGDAVDDFVVSGSPIVCTKTGGSTGSIPSLFNRDFLFQISAITAGTGSIDVYVGENIFEV